ncbi:recombinase family protein [uncultured Microbacterium sp.]|uniref:recombinase family protein n=1 Tax=uncultured Microbacterium sp. TaxID=191216 RepID=UPI0025DEA85D|nr:recombinase family protein [uncultured Microbacterium sp.]
MRPRACLYVRLSQESERSTSIAGQHEDLDLLALQEGWDVVARFEDNGLSGGKERANARAALQMIVDGKADVLAVYAYDRWSRMGIEKAAELIGAINARKRAGRPALFIAQREGIRSDQEDWELRVAFSADLAKRERDRMVARTTASLNRLRNSGRFAGGVVGFGYRPADNPEGPGRTLVLSPFEAATVQEVAGRIIKGESLVAIARDLTERGVARTRSPYRSALIHERDPEGLDRGRWDQSNVQALWSGQSLLGRVTNKGEVVRDERGVPITPFPPIITLDQHGAILARFGQSRGMQKRRRAKRLASGLILCGVCGGRMYAKATKGGDYYACSASARGVVCAQPRMKADIVDELIEKHYLRNYGELPEAITIEHSKPQGALELAEVAEAIDATAGQFRDPTADRAALLARLDALQARRAELEAMPLETTSEVKLTGKTVGQAWADADLDRRRELLSKVYEAWEVMPLEKGKPRNRSKPWDRLNWVARDVEGWDEYPV